MMIDFNEISAISKTWNYRKTEDRNGTEDSFTIPEYSEKLKLKKIGGKSVVWNQNLNIINRSKTVHGVNITSNDNGSIVLNGTADANMSDLSCSLVFSMISGYKYLFTGYNGHENSGVAISDTKSYSTRQNDRIYTASSSVDSVRLNIYILSNSTFENVTLYPKCVNLTKLFGAGNEPTTTTDPRIAAIKKYLETHPEYNEGEIIDSLVDEIEVKDTDEETTSLLPTNFPSLKSAGNVYDYIDFTSAVKLPNGNYNVNVVRNVGQVDLGSLSYDKSSAGDNRFYSTSLQSIIKPSCVNYTSIIFIYGNSDKTCRCDAIGTVYFILSPYTTTQEFKQAMEGQILYYELATPTIETITISAELLEWLKVEYGGNMYYNQDGLSLPIPNTTTIHKHIEKTEELSQIVIDDEVVWSAALYMFNLYDDDIIIDDEIPIDDETSVNEDEVINNE